MMLPDFKMLLTENPMLLLTLNPGPHEKFSRTCSVLANLRRKTAFTLQLQYLDAM